MTNQRAVMTNQDDVARDLVQRAHAAEGCPDFDVEAGLSDVLARAGVRQPAAKRSVTFQTLTGGARHPIELEPHTPIADASTRARAVHEQDLKLTPGGVIRLLGDVGIWVHDQPIDVGHARQRCVLAVLAVEANHVVPVDTLTDRLWGDRPPQRARETLYNYLSRLRRALGPITEIELARASGGYVLRVDPMAVDVHRFHRLVGKARAADDEGRALVLFEEALGLWRGKPFTGLDSAWVSTLRDVLERERFAAELDSTDLYLRRGRPGWLLGDLLTRAEAHPLDERVAGQVMLALYQCGRQAEALEHFRQRRRRLVEELGINPNPRLERLYEQILIADPALTARLPVSGDVEGRD